MNECMHVYITYIYLYCKYMTQITATDGFSIVCSALFLCVCLSVCFDFGSVRFDSNNAIKFQRFVCLIFRFCFRVFLFFIVSGIHITQSSHTHTHSQIKLNEEKFGSIHFVFFNSLCLLLHTHTHAHRKGDK